MKLLLLCLSALFFLALLFLLFSLVLFRYAHVRRSHYPADKREYGGNRSLPPSGEAYLKESRQWFDAQSPQRVTILSQDGLRLSADLLLSPQGLGIVPCFHGYHSSGRRDLSAHAKILHEAGYHVLIVHQRAHGESEGKYICFGTKERLDARDWCLWSENRFPDLPIFLLGLSMGASTVLMSTGTALPPSVRGIVADCGFSSPFEIIANTLRHKHKIHPYPVIYGMDLWSRILAGFHYRQQTCAEALRNSTLPVLMIHGEADRYVPAEMSHRTAKRFPEQIELWTIPSAPHSQSIYYDPKGYQSRLVSFLEQHR